MNIIDEKFNELISFIGCISEMELYYHIRKKFDSVSLLTRQSMMDYFNKFSFWGKINMTTNNYEEIELKVKDLKKYLVEYQNLYKKLSDYKSKKILYATINNWVNYDFKNLADVIDKCYDDYFDLDIIPQCNKEILVDLGAYTGDSILSFINNYGKNSYEKIYGYEITPSSFEKLTQNVIEYEKIILKLKGAGDEKGYMSINEHQDSASANSVVDNGNGNVEIVTLDEDILEPISIIKADIEGFEKKAIIGAKNHILKDHPKLLISVYHNNNDLWEIPKIISEIDSSYKFYLRYHGGAIYPTEITLIAI